jgi:hypothetical protein
VQSCPKAAISFFLFLEKPSLAVIGYLVRQPAQPSCRQQHPQLIPLVLRVVRIVALQRVYNRCIALLALACAIFAPVAHELGQCASDLFQVQPLHASNALPFCYLHLLHKSASVLTSKSVTNESTCCTIAPRKRWLASKHHFLEFGGKVSENAVMAACRQSRIAQL